MRIGGRRRDKWERLGAVSHGVAKSVYERRLQAVREETLLPKRKIPTLGDIWGEYALRSELQSKNWNVNVRTYRARFEKEWGADRPANQLTGRDIETLRLKLLQEGKSRSTVDRYCAMGRSAWNRYRIALPNPFAQIKFYSPDNQIIEYLTEDEETRLLEVARETQPMLYEMMCVALATGLRASNLLTLRWDQIDMEQDIITVTQKGGHPHVAVFNGDIHGLLGTIPRTDSPFLWTNPRTGKPYQDLGKTFHSLMRNAGIDRRFTWQWHLLRHTAGSRIVQAGLGLQVAKEHLGHRDIKTTLRYAHLNLESKKRAAEVTSPSVVTIRVTTVGDRLKRPRKSKP